MSSECSDAAAVNVVDSVSGGAGSNVSRPQRLAEARASLTSSSTRCATAPGSCNAANGIGFRLAITIHVSVPLWCTPSSGNLGSLIAAQ
jgi:hypothetical protein